MSNRQATARAQLDAWREQRADRLDPVRFHVMDALERRAAHHEGEARRLLDARLSALLEAYAGELEQSAPASNPASEAATPDFATSVTLGGLVERMASHALARTATGDASPQPAAFPTLDALDDFRKLWSRLRTESQLRQSLEQAPANAGPLNSGALVHRSIALMRELSPGYLQHFLSYVDDLSSLEPLGGFGAATLSDSPQPASPGKRTRSRSRAKRD
jgi:hypothetical protein